MKTSSAPILGMTLSCLLLSSAANATLVVDHPPIDLGRANVLLGFDPIVVDGSTITYTITGDDATSGEVFFQFEASENDSSIQLGLAFSLDAVLFYDFDTVLNDGFIDSPVTLSLSQNQTAIEWRISGITGAEVGSQLSVVLDIAGAGGGPERARFSQTSAVPEPSAILFGTLVCGVLGIYKLKSIRKCK